MTTFIDTYDPINTTGMSHLKAEYALTKTSALIWIYNFSQYYFLYEHPPPPSDRRVDVLSESVTRLERMSLRLVSSGLRNRVVGD